MSKLIYGWTLGFGDTWALVNRAISEVKDLEILWSTRIWHHQDVKDAISNLRTDKKILWVNKDGNINDFKVEMWDKPYLKTKNHWIDPLNSIRRKTNKIKKIVFQIDTPANHHSDRKFTKEEILSFKKIMIKLLGKIDFIPIGKPKTVKQIIDIACQAEIFFGTCSGMSHLCHSVGLPIYIRNYSNLHNCHKGKEYKPFKRFQDIIPKILEIAETKSK